MVVQYCVSYEDNMTASLKAKMCSYFRVKAMEPLFAAEEELKVWGLSVCTMELDIC